MSRFSSPARVVSLSGSFVGDYARGKLVALDPATGRFEEWRNPAGSRSAPYAMAGDDRSRCGRHGRGPHAGYAFRPARPSPSYTPTDA
jgi:hypothetical protein